jgi:hypothetical protein
MRNFLDFSGGLCEGWSAARHHNPISGSADTILPAASSTNNGLRDGG